MRCEPCSRSPTAAACRSSLATCVARGVEPRRHRRHAGGPQPREGIEAGSVGDLTAMPPLAGGQVKTYHPAVYAGILARRDRPEQLSELAEQGMGTSSTSWSSTCAPSRPQVGARIVPIDEAIEMIDVGGAGALSAAARNFAGVAAVSDPAQYAQVVEEIGTPSAMRLTRSCDSAWPPRPSRWWRPTDAEVAAYLDHDRGNTLPPSADAGPREVRATWPTARTRTSAARSTARRATAAGTLADAARLQVPHRPSTTYLDLDAAHRITADFTGPHGRHRQARQPRRAGIGRTTLARGVPTRAGDRTPSAPSVDRGRQSDARRGDGHAPSSANAYETRRRPGYDRRRGRASSRPRKPGWPSSPFQPRPDGRHARLRHRRPRLSSASAAACSSRPDDRAASSAAELQRRDHPAADP